MEPAYGVRGAIEGLYRDNGTENGNYYLRFRVYRAKGSKKWNPPHINPLLHWGKLGGFLGGSIFLDPKP